ncbi:mRNA interferase MazF [Geotoga petraea]|uniref:mRNA interferase n=1 Tax=Geotoga petraea TaxID=28234 RepID=A0A1G6HPQ0_9BACT|nr:type II toxin-antitoxin system PemK/MazF family toxin [Geotoga petraea]SDB96277.1 mRNA interferase MazF [Geotoga petraea]
MIKQYEIFLIDLNPTKGSKINKVRPCLVISPDEMNHNLNTIIVAPLTSKIKNTYPFRVKTTIKDVESHIVLDQIRTLDKSRFIKKIGMLTKKEIQEVKYVLEEMLIK